MLIMKCPKCDKYINSALLAEITTVVCEHCNVEVPVANVLVSSNGFTFDRNDLLKRFFRYRKLLDEVIDERNSLVGNTAASEVSKSSIEQFMSILQGMLTGARDNFRCEFSVPLPVWICYSTTECFGNVFNLSTEGVGIEIPRTNLLPRVGGVILAEFSLPDAEEKFSISGEICWTQKAGNGDQSKHSVGVKFNGLDPSIQAKLWQFVSALASDVPE